MFVQDGVLYLIVTKHKLTVLKAQGKFVVRGDYCCCVPARFFRQATKKNTLGVIYFSAIQ
jgi:hypothetical protein